MFFGFQSFPLSDQVLDFGVDHFLLFLQAFVQSQQLLGSPQISTRVLVFQSGMRGKEMADIRKKRPDSFENDRQHLPSTNTLHAPTSFRPYRAIRATPWGSYWASSAGRLGRASGSWSWDLSRSFYRPNLASWRASFPGYLGERIKEREIYWYRS